MVMKKSSDVSRGKQLLAAVILYVIPNTVVTFTVGYYSFKHRQTMFKFG